MSSGATSESFENDECMCVWKMFQFSSNAINLLEKSADLEIV